MEGRGLGDFGFHAERLKGERELRKAKDICGLPVIEVSGGRQLGNVCDIVIERDGSASGLLIDTKMWFSSPRWIDWLKVISIGEDAVTIPGEEAIEPLPDKSGHFFLNQETPKLTGLPVMTQNGHRLGVIEDVYFSTEMDKRIIGFELSEGFLSDLKDGRKWLPAPKEATLGADVILVPARCREQLEQLL